MNKEKNLIRQEVESGIKIDTLSHIREVYGRFEAVDEVLEGIDDGDPIHLAARDLWRAIKADLRGEKP